jgi:hypothetical protein
VDATNVTFIMANGKTVVYALSKLSDDSRKVIEAAGKGPDAEKSAE